MRTIATQDLDTILIKSQPASAMVSRSCRSDRRHSASVCLMRYGQSVWTLESESQTLSISSYSQWIG
ncbi:hypothetical protein LSTR_LSTR007380 [Laodelphax striatellus]|uniref:Uncharacterized protein n=1 Tax=Laodelphax striatellus TaxID=195883 RepID=A0A482XNH4_LAOST|nr:hypothetical protein LSTR_LSTR007380 [Laodelphax striatellus]